MLTRSLSAHLPVVFFGCVACATALATSWQNLWAGWLAALAAGAACRFCFKRGDEIARDCCLLIFFTAAVYIWALPQFHASLDELVGKAREFTVTVTTLPQSAGHAVYCRAEVKDIADSASDSTVTLIDYGRRVEYLKSYRFEGRLDRTFAHGHAGYVLRCKKSQRLEVLPDGVGARTAQALSRYFLEKFKRYFSPLTARFLSSLFLGRYELLKEERSYFIDCGTTHLLAISGLNMALVGAVLFFVFGLFYIPYRTRLVLAAGCIYGYTLLCGASPSAMRAALMFIVIAASFFLKRRPDLLNTLALAGLIAVLSEPRVLGAISFVLSYACLLAIVVNAAVWGDETVSPAWLNFLAQGLSISLAVWFLISPLTAYYFGRIYPAAIFYNIFLVPFCNLILLVTFIFASAVCCAPVCALLAPVLETLCVWFIGLNRFLAALPGAFVECRFSALAVVICYFLLAAGLFIVYRRIYNGLHALPDVRS